METLAPGADCPLGGTVIHTGQDVNQDGVLGEEEIAQTQFVCQRPGQRSQLIPEPAGAHCPRGGKALQQGPDTNGNDVLDPDEVTHTDYFCDAAPPPVLMRTEAEAPGGHCVSGGRRIHSGLDVNGDGVLGEDEIQSTQYVCATRELVRVDTLAAGTSCPGGGVAVRSGPDLDGDGVLQDGEVAKTELVCDRFILGDVHVTTPAQLRALADVAVITGSLSLGSALELAEVDLPSLRFIGQELQVQSHPELRRLSLPALTQVGGTLWLTSCPRLRGVNLGALRQVGAALVVTGNPELEALRLPALESTGGALQVDTSPKISALEAPALRKTGLFWLSHLALESLEFPNLGETGWLRLVNNPTVKQVKLLALQQVHGNLDVASMPQLQTLQVPNVYRVEGTFDFSTTQALLSVSMPELQEITGDFNLTANQALRTFDAPKLRGIGGGVSIEVNTALTTLDGLRGLVTVGRTLNLEGNPQLTSTEGLASLESVPSYLTLSYSGVTDFHLPALRSAEVIIVGCSGLENKNLRSVRFPKLTSMRALSLCDSALVRTLSAPSLKFLTHLLYITQTPQLPRCQVNALLTQLRAPPLEVAVGGVDEDATCP